MTWFHFVSFYTFVCYIILHSIVFSHFILCSTILSDIMLRYIIFYCAMLNRDF